ncbi:Pectinesterase protein [Dioscorea alata]|uniref:Pectinesterase protein n=1 Tax=Dioscorea alata TaxID=55571 RepID=A0ACB7U4V0_DIOAL|nr:Pectinesterase protein [Dioscorea alata]
MELASSLTSVITVLFLVIFSPGCATSSSPAGNFTPSSEFMSNVRSTIDEVQNLISLLSPFVSTIGGGDLRLSSAVSDCLDLLDLSSDQLSLSLSPSGGTGNRVSDLRAWLSAALGNQDTCHESLSGTDGIVATLISTGLDTVTSLVSSSLEEISSSSTIAGRRKLLRPNTTSFPAWLKAGDRRLLQAASPKPDVVVAQDGSGNYTTVTEAVEAAPSESWKRYVIYVKKGVYRENVEIKKKKWNLMMIGDGVGLTLISGNRSFVDGWTTFRSATFAVAGKGFIARDLSIENSAGPEKHQAVALRSDSDLSVYYHCSIHGYQDTLYAHSLRQFYRECLITGTVDAIFGNAAAVFQNCQILARRPLPNQKNSLTAQGRKDPNQNTGFSFQFCNVSSTSDLIANETFTYLGRPWKEYSRTVFMQSYLGSAIRPEGWLAWQGEYALDTLYYGEYMNFGPGSGLGNRVKWSGYHAITDLAQAINFTVSQFIDGNLWLPSTGVKFTAGLTF